uniref:Choline/carnitine acyltransferase domain-containing protein n=1 Tax=Panagrolaimus sp. JU765 TaxID=591449 RepID=A0AC34QCC7_9BILA
MNQPSTILKSIPIYRLSSQVAFSSYQSDEYQFLHKSVIPTYHFQKSLRRLPIPKLEDSARRYLNAVKAVVSENDFKEAESVMKTFLNGEGPALQKELIAFDKQNKHTSYVSEPWFDMYLKSRLPCPVNFNPFMMYAGEADAKYNDQLSRATNFAISCARMKRALDAEILAPEVFHLDAKKSDTDLFRKVCKTLPSRLSWFGAVAFKAFPLDMSQYKSLFGGNRVPNRGKDILHHCPNPKHFLVMYKGNIYAVDLFDANGNVLEPNVVHASLANILNSNDVAKAEECIGSLTTMERDTWADLRNQLVSSDKNRASLKYVDDALFLMCLDDLKTTDPQRLVQSLLCGDDGRNRWFDKCFQLIVDGNGQATINFEHSWGDGVAVLRLMEESLRDTSKHHFVGPNQQVKGNPKFKKLEWELNDGIKKSIIQAQAEHVDRCKDLQFATVEYFGLTREKIKQYKLSPDSIMQLAIQLGFHKTYKEFVPTYESCSTAAFLKGRTECIRSATVATRDAVLQIEGLKQGNIKETIRACSNTHSQLVKEASLGQGFDRHLLGLKMTAERLGQKIPELYQNKTFNYMNQFVLSTSTLSTPTIVFGGFGPVVPNGFGIGYNVAGSKMGAVISSYKSKRDANKMAQSIIEGLDEIRHVMDK